MKKLRAENIVKTYKGRKVVKGVSLEVNQGEIIGLLGPNGAGKTTSFYMIVGLIKPNSGHIYLDKTEITNFPMYKRAQHGIGYLAQEPSVFRKLSIEDNILSVLQLTNLTKKERAKLEAMAIKTARRRLGYDREGTRVVPTPREWEAIQKGAISNSMMEHILANSDLDTIKSLALPKEKLPLAGAQKDRIKTLRSNGANTAQIAEALGISTARVREYLNG